MKKTKTLIWGIASGLLCALAVFLYMHEVKSEAEAARAEALSRYGGEQIEVCVAQRDIAVGEKIDSSNVTTKLWVADLLPEDAVSSLSDVAGKQVTSPILSGEVVSDKRFQASEQEWEVPEGLSVLSVPAKDIQTVGGSLCAGMYVDVYSTGTSTNLLAQNILVVTTNVDSEEKSSGSSISWVTLALKPESVQEIVAASQKTELYFVLPGSEEKENS